MESFVFILVIFASIFCSAVTAVVFADHANIRDLLRRKRSLLFPNPLDSETKVQVLFGLGLPMEGEVSMTLGYVLKCNYDLPYNSSDFTDGPYVRYARNVKNEDVKRSSGAPSEKTGTISRWSLYRMLEMIMEAADSSSGKACLLRAVCEAAETPFLDDYDGPSHGLLGELLHVVLTPSTTHEEYEMYSDREYQAAEVIGRDSDGRACGLAYPECLYSPLDYFTRKSATFLP